MRAAAPVGWLAAVAFCATAGSSSGDETELISDRPLRVQPAVGDTNVFTVVLEKDVFAHLELYQTGVDVSVTIEGPGSETLIEVDDTLVERPSERASWITSGGGLHRITVRTKEVVSRGFFELRMDPPRPRRPTDEGWIRNERRLVELAADEAPLPAGWAAEVGDVATEARRLGDLRTEARAQKELGCRLQDFEVALEHALNAAEYATETSDPSLEDVFSCAAAQLGRLGYLDEAIDVHRDLLARRRGGHPFLETEALSNLGHYLLQRGDLAEAADLFHQAHDVAAREKDHQARAIALGLLGRLHMESGAYQEALDALSEAIAVHRERADRVYLSSRLVSIAEVYYELGDLAAAADAAQEAIDGSAALGRPTALVALRTRGLVRLEQGATAEGLRDLRRAADLARKYTVSYLPGALNRLGRAEFQLGRLADSRRHHQEALRASEQTGRPAERGEALLGLCAVDERAGRLEAAEKSCAEALELLTRIGLDRGRVAALYRSALVARRQARLDAARGALENALELIDARRYRLRRVDLRETYVAGLREIEDEYVDLLVALAEREPGGRWESAAFEASEQRRARSLRELLLSSPQAVTEGADAELLGQDRLLRGRLGQVLMRQVGLASGSSLDADKIAREVNDLTAAVEDVSSRIRAASPRYAAVTQPRPTTLREVQGTVLDRSSTMLFYALGERRSHLWVVSPTGLKRYGLPRRDVFEAAVARIHRAVSRRADAASALATLGRTLLRPALADLQDKRLLVVADGALLYLPFAALPDPRGGGPLIRRNEVVHLPSAGAVLALRDATRGETTRTVAVLADPVFSVDDLRVASGARKPGATPAPLTRGSLARALTDVGQQQLWRLQGTRREADAIRRLVPAADSRFAFDFEASRATALAPEIGSYRFLHFATHGFINSARPELSGLVLSLVDAQGRPQEGLLTSLDTFNLKLSADVVVLSGCRTALGKQVQGEGIVGLMRGFMYAGARGVLASLWPVDDRATASLMGTFYQGMLGPQRLDPPAALRRAQLSLLSSPRWSSPYYWAAFQLQGDWRTAPPVPEAR